MRMLAVGELAPTVAHCVWLLAPRGGSIFAWERPGAKTCPHGRPLRVASCPPGGPHFFSGAARRKNLPPRSPTACGFLPPEGAAFLLGSGPSKKPAPKVLAPTVADGVRSKSPIRARGFTLLELLLVLAIIAVATAGVSFALRDSAQSQLEREAVRLAALLESARARSQASGVPVVWRSTETGFIFDGLAAGALAEGWLAKGVGAAVPSELVLGPEPITWPQGVRLVSVIDGARTLEVKTDGVRPYFVQAVQSADAAGARVP